MRCSICGAEGVTKQTCPFNPEATNPKPLKHNPVPLSSKVKAKAKASPGTSTAVAVAPPKIKAKIIKPLPKPKPKAKAKAEAKPETSSISIEAAEAEARRMFPGDFETQQEYVTDILKLDMPHVPKDDEVSKVFLQRKDKLKQTRIAMADRCQRCLTSIKARGMLKDADWFTVGHLCAECHQHIGTLYHNTDFKEPYKRYHRGTELPVDQLITHGAKDGYYNATMYDGAKFWAEAAGRRAIKAFPKVPK